MTKKDYIKETHTNSLKKLCESNRINYDVLTKLLEIEKSKKIFKKYAQMQQQIDRLIENEISNEN